jgi:uncharacterized protein
MLDKQAPNGKIDGLSAGMLVLHVSQIPLQGKDIDAPLEPGGLHVEGEDSFTLLDGGRIRGHVEKGDDDSVHVRAHVRAGLRIQCARCLEPSELPIDQEVELFLLPQHAEPEEQEEEVELSDRDLVVGYYSGDRLDLGELLREQLLLDLPMKRLCRDDCRGLCPSCGLNRNTGTCECRPQEEEGDPRLATLKTLIDKGSKA